MIVYVLCAGIDQKLNVFLALRWVVRMESGDVADGEKKTNSSLFS